MLSIVIPLYNEEKNVEPLYRELTTVLNSVEEKYEIIVVDDGSTDRSFDTLKKIAERDKALKIIRFKRNFGQSTALSAGFQHARGDIVITMDADLQNDPKDIPKLLAELKKGYDVVCGWRKDRKDPLFSKRIPSLFSNWLVSRMSGLKIHDSGCTLRAYKKEAIKDISLYGEMHRYIPFILAVEGNSITEIEVRHNPRKHGKTKYNFLRLLKGISDLFTLMFIEKFGTKPAHIFSSLGILMSGISSLILAYLLFIGLVYTVNINRPLFYISLILIIVGAQSITFGFLGEMIARVRYEVEGKRFYKIKEIVN